MKIAKLFPLDCFVVYGIPTMGFAQYIPTMSLCY